MKGFIVIEGLDGSGTTTQLDNISAFLNKQNISYIRTFEPTDMETGKFIRRVLSGQVPLEQETIAYLFAADRNEHIYGNHGIIKKLESYPYVISDRYHFSSIAYQSIGSAKDLVLNLNSRFPLPEHLVFIDVPVEECQRRIRVRNGVEDIYDHCDYQKKVLENYNQALDGFSQSPMNIIRIDGTLPPLKVTKSIIDAIFSH